MKRGAAEALTPTKTLWICGSSKKKIKIPPQFFFYQEHIEQFPAILLLFSAVTHIHTPNLLTQHLINSYTNITNWINKASINPFSFSDSQYHNRILWTNIFTSTIFESSFNNTASCGYFIYTNWNTTVMQARGRISSISEAEVRKGTRTTTIIKLWQRGASQTAGRNHSHMSTTT
jgi:hypothetical protein